MSTWPRASSAMSASSTASGFPSRACSTALRRRAMAGEGSRAMATAEVIGIILARVVWRSASAHCGRRLPCPALAQRPWAGRAAWVVIEIRSWRRWIRVVVSRVTRSFGATVALRGVDAQFLAGEVTTLEGHNGSGKSTLLGILGTLCPPRPAGHLWFRRFRICRYSQANWLGVPRHTVLSGLDGATECGACGVALRGLAVHWVDAMAERFGRKTLRRFTRSPAVSGATSTGDLGEGAGPSTGPLVAR